MKAKAKFALFLIIIFISQFITAAVVKAEPSHSLEVASPSAILINAQTGQILFEKNDYQRMYPASITKIMTAILAIEKGNLRSRVVMSHKAIYEIDPGSSNAGLLEGEDLSLEQLIYCALLNSANEAANGIAEAIGGNEENFAKMMTQRAKELGAKDTNFANPNGLPNNNHYTTAYDMAMIAKHAMTLPEFRKIVATKDYTLPPTNKNPKSKDLHNGNKLLGNSKYYYKYAIGVKTGYTIAAGSTFVGAASKNGVELIAVVLDAPIEGYNSYMYLDPIKMFNYGFDNFQTYKSFDKNHVLQTIKVKGGNKALLAVPENEINILIPKDINTAGIKTVQKINSNITAPVKKGDIIGYISIEQNGKSLGKINIVANNSVDKSMFFGLGLPKEKTFASILWFLVKWIVFVLILLVLMSTIGTILYNKYLSYTRGKRKIFIRRRY